MASRLQPPSSPSSFDAVWGQIQKSLTQGVEGRPAGEGWKTVREFASSCEPKIAVSHARNILHDLSDRGLMEKAKGKDGAHWSIYYRPKM